MWGQASNLCNLSLEALDHDLARFTIGHNFFPRSSSIIDLNGKGKLGGEEEAPLRECLNSYPGKGGRIVVQSKKKIDVKISTD